MSGYGIESKRKQKYYSNICSHILIGIGYKRKDWTNRLLFWPGTSLTGSGHWICFCSPRVGVILYGNNYPILLVSMHNQMETGIPVSGRLRQTIMNKSYSWCSYLFDFDRFSPMLLCCRLQLRTVKGNFLFTGLSFNWIKEINPHRMDSKYRLRGCLQLDSMAHSNDPSFNMN